MRKKTPLLIGFVVATILIVGVAVVAFVTWQERRMWTNDAQIEAYGIDLSSNVSELVVSIYGDYV